jgi:uncharacterized protein YecA (UPF0149 family)
VTVPVEIIDPEFGAMVQWWITGPARRLAWKTDAHAGPKVGRNDPCPCGSGRKFKKCCGA